MREHGMSWGAGNPLLNPFCARTIGITMHFAPNFSAETLAMVVMTSGESAFESTRRPDHMNRFCTMPRRRNSYGNVFPGAWIREMVKAPGSCQAGYNLKFQKLEPMDDTPAGPNKHGFTCVLLVFS